MSQTASPVSEAEFRKIICEPLAGDLLVQVAERLGKQLVDKKLRASQIRAILDEAQSIEALFQRGRDTEAIHRAYLLDPKMSYRAKRAGGGAMVLAIVLKGALKVVLESKNNRAKVKQRYARFLDFFEAIVAYHKVYGGMD